LGLLFALLSLVKAENTVRKKPVPISELACFISSLLNLLADFAFSQTWLYCVMDMQCVTVVVIPNIAGGKQYKTLYTKVWRNLILDTKTDDC